MTVTSITCNGVKGPDYCCACEGPRLTRRSLPVYIQQFQNTKYKKIMFRNPFWKVLFFLTAMAEGMCESAKHMPVKK